MIVIYSVSCWKSCANTTRRHFSLTVWSIYTLILNLMANAAYLIEHGLVGGDLRMTSTGRGDFLPTKLALTANGLDFLEDDGGLTAVLGTLTVRLHADSVRDLLAKQIEASELEDSVKSQLIAEGEGLASKRFGNNGDRAR
ncbi:hypothetical protein KXR94_16115 [Stutzerimonas stutzeri]